MEFARRSDKQSIEEGTGFAPKFDEQGLIPCICQDAVSGDVLMFAFMSDEALKETLKTRVAHYYSRSRGKLWKKGESSGNLQEVVEVRTDCDQDVILIKVKPAGAACHTGYPTCFFRKVNAAEETPTVSLKISGYEKAFDPDQVYKK